MPGAWHFRRSHVGPWGNGSPTDSGSVSPGSNPGGPASRTRAHPNLVFACDAPARGNVKLRRMSEERSLHEEVRSVWNELAPFWDERMEAGATWQRHLIQPSVERLLR